MSQTLVNNTNVPQVFFDAGGNAVTLKPKETRIIRFDTDRNIPEDMTKKAADVVVNPVETKKEIIPPQKKGNGNILFTTTKIERLNKRVLFLLHTNQIGGAELLFHGIIKNLPPDYKAYVCYFHEVSDVSALREHPCEFIELEHIISNDKPMAIGVLSQILDVDLICMTNVGSPTRKIIKEHTKAKVVEVIHSEHGVSCLFPKNTMLSERYDGFIAINPNTKQYLQNWFGKDCPIITCIQNGVDTEKFSPKENISSKLTVGNISRISPEKNIEFFSKIADEFDTENFKFIWVGGVAKQCPYKKNPPTLSDKVEITGYVYTNLEEYYHKLDVFLLTSLHEGTPLSVLEAMACGLPVISTPVGNMHKLIAPECIIENKEQAVILINKFQRDAKLRQKIGAQNRKTILDNFAISNTALNYANFFETIIGERK